MALFLATPSLPVHAAPPDAAGKEAADGVSEPVHDPEPVDGSEAGSEAVPEAKPTAPPLDPTSRHSLAYTNLFVARINPLGLENRLWLGYRYRLYAKDAKKLFSTSHVALFFSPVVSPAVARLSGTLEVMPLAVLRLRATYGYMQYYGTFQYLQSYDDPGDDYSPQAQDEGVEDGSRYATNGGQAELAALLQLKAWRIAVRNDLQMQYNHMNLRGDDDLFYDIRLDMLVPNHGWVLLNDSDLLYVHPFKRGRSLVAGARATVMKGLYADGVWEGDARSPDNLGVRVGPLLAYTFFDKPDKRFNKPTILLLSQWHVVHRWRTGVTTGAELPETGVRERGTSQAMPTLVLGFAFSGEILGRN